MNDLVFMSFSGSLSVSGSAFFSRGKADPDTDSDPDPEWTSLLNHLNGTLT
jgi:hypothetical protein